MSAAYDIEQWTDFFVAFAGGSAALAGLVFVAVSLNLEQILGYPGLPERAFATLALLITPLVVSLFGLAPQSNTAIGIELIATGVIFGGGLAVLTRLSLPPGGKRSWLVGRATIAGLGTLPIAIAGPTLLAEDGGGLYWALGGMLAALVGGVTNAWVLLVEIRR